MEAPCFVQYRSIKITTHASPALLIATIFFQN